MIVYFIKTLFKRSYKYLSLTFFSILVGAFLFGAILGVTRSISNYFVSEGKTLIGGDIVLSSSREIKEDGSILEAILAKSEKANREYSVQAIFKNSSNATTSAATVRAVEGNFPLYGTVELEGNKVFSLTENENAVYAEKSFLDKIDAKVDDEISLGAVNYKVRGVIKKEPDSVSVGVSFSPKVIMLVSDFNKSGLDLAQSRATYKIAIKENPNNPFTAAELTDVESYAKENKIRFDDSTDGPNNLVRGLSSVQSFAGIVLGIALFLVVVNIVANLSYVILKFRKVIAILKTFGATSKQIRYIYVSILGILGLTAGFFGALLGGLVSNASLAIFSKYLVGNIEATSVLPIALQSSAFGFLIITASSLPFFLSLNDISPKQLLSKISSQTGYSYLRMIIFYIPIPILLFLFLYTISSNVTLSLYSVLGLIGIFLFYLVLSFILIRILYRKRSSFSLIVGSSIASLKWRGVETVVILASIMTAFSGIFIISAIEKNIVVNLNRNVSNSAPALYIVDISKGQLEKVREISGESFREYASIRGRLLKVNDRDMTLSDDPGITREFNMTYRADLLASEKVVSGVWHGESKRPSSVSIDNSFAKEIGGVKVGDTIQVFVQGLEITATVTSLHEAERTSGAPFFFLVFSPDVLEKFPASYFATVTASAEDIKVIENKLGATFPNIIPIQTGKIIDTVNKLLGNVIFVVKLIGIPSLVLGLILIMIMTSQSLYERRRDVLILRAFGLTKSNITKLFTTEVSFIILIASVVSYGIAQALAFMLNTLVFNFETLAFSLTPIYISVFIFVIIIIFAYFVSGSIVKSSLKDMLAEK